MKRILKTVGLAGLLALYCFTTSFYSGAIPGQEAFSAGTTHAIKTESSQQVVSKYSFCHDAPKEHTISVRTPAAPSSLKSRFSDADVLNVALVHSYMPGFLQYSFFSRHHIPRLRSCDIIFPFHYFW